MKQSGFFDYLFKKGQEEYSVKKPNNTIYTHGNNRADSVFSGKLIETASKFVWGEMRRCPGVQNTFTELMANTYKHASATEGEHHWWISMTKDLEQKKVVFGFVDYGVGIFRSLLNKSPQDRMYKGLEKLWQKFPWANNNAKAMKLILEGELHKTVTQQSNRGRGLPYIHSCQEAKSIDSLVIISKFMSLYLSLRRTLDNINSIYPIIGELRKKEVLNEWRTVKNVATYTPFGNANVMITINNDKVSYNPSKRSEVISKLSDFRKILFDLQVEVYKG